MKQKFYTAVNRFLSQLIVALFTLSFSVSLSTATEWIVNQDTSTLKFEVNVQKQGFKGRFTQFATTIVFNPAALNESSVVVTVDLESFDTGNKLVDDTVKTAAWFASLSNKTASFQSTQISETNKDQYASDGLLSIKGSELPVQLTMVLKITGDDAEAIGATSISRIAFGIGRKESSAIPVA